MSKQTAVFLSDNILRLFLRDDKRVYQNTATVTVTLKDANGVDVPGAESLTMTYDGGGKGVYEVVLEDTLNLSLGASYKAIVVAVSNGMQRRFVANVVVIE